MLFSQGSDQEKRADLLRPHGASRIRGCDILEHDIGAIEIIFLPQHLGDAMIDLAADHADGMPAQLGDTRDPRSGGATINRTPRPVSATALACRRSPLSART